MLAALAAAGCEVKTTPKPPPVVALECGDTYDFSAVLRGSAAIYRCSGGQAVRGYELVECRCERAKEAP